MYEDTPGPTACPAASGRWPACHLPHPEDFLVLRSADTPRQALVEEPFPTAEEHPHLSSQKGPPRPTEVPHTRGHQSELLVRAHPDTSSDMPAFSLHLNEG